tara:strand:+ start:487 stop:705 length:219 start_codon:yes stop_codon:yes gene_type:complete
MKRPYSKTFDIVFNNEDIADACVKYLQLKKILKNFKKNVFISHTVLRIKCKVSKENVSDILKKKFKNKFNIF